MSHLKQSILSFRRLGLYSLGGFFYSILTRPLPIAIFWATLVLTVKVGVIWHECGPNISLTHSTASAEDKPINTPQSSSIPSSGSSANSEAPASSERFDPLDLSDNELTLLRSLAERRTELEMREKKISEREALLKAVEKRLEQTVTELADTRKRLEESLKKQEELKKEQDSYKNAKTQWVVKIYETLTPENAATLLSGLDMNTVITVLDGMKEAKVSAILDKMSPEIARAITIEFFRRRNLVDALQEEIAPKNK